MPFSELTEEFNEKMRITALPVVIFIGLLSILGLLGNCIVIFVYNRKYPKCNFKYFVLVLAVIDLGSCLVLMPMEMYTLLHWFVYEYSWLCKAKSFFNVFTVSSSASTLLLIAIDRFRKVCRPHGKQIQPDLAVKLAILVLSISIIPSTSDAVFWGIHTHTYQYNGSNLTLKMCEKDDEFKNTIFPKLHVVILYAGLNSVVMLSTIGLYSIIAVKMFCVRSMPNLSAPKIMVTTPLSEDSGGLSTPAAPNNRPSIFRFPSDAGIESGLSESDDTGLHSSVNLSDSQGDVTDDERIETSKIDPVVAELSVEDNGEQLEMVPLRRKNPKASPPKKALRISIEVANDSENRNSLQLPAIEIRKPPRSPKLSPTFKDDVKEKDAATSRAYHRRRSTIASLTGRSSTRLRRKTLIMFILTAVFVGTTVLYFCLIGYMADEGILVTSLTAAQRAVWLFFLRLYFVNSVINPVLYGFLDPRFRRALWNMGIRVRFFAGSIKKNLGQSIRRANSGRISRDMSSAMTTAYPRPILKSRSSVVTE